MAKKFVSNDKDQHRLKAQRDSIVSLQREIKILKQQIRTLEKALNRPHKEDGPVATEKVEKPKKPTPAEAREATRLKFAEWRAKQTAPKEDS